MGKKDRKKRPAVRVAPPVSSLPAPFVSRRGWRIIGAGIVVAVLGYVILSFTDPGGQNWASRVSPFVILAGYAVIATGIVVKE